MCDDFIDYDEVAEYEDYLGDEGWDDLFDPDDLSDLDDLDDCEDDIPF